MKAAMVVAASRVWHRGNLLLLALSFSTIAALHATEVSPNTEASCSASARVLLQRQLLHRGKGVHADPDTEVVKFLAGVPVYNYGYIQRLARCEEQAETGNCELHLLQTSGTHPAWGVTEDWKKDFFHDDDERAVPGEVPQKRDEDKDDPGRKPWRRIIPGRAREWLVKMHDGISDQMILNFCDVLPGNAKCVAQGHPSQGGIPLVVVRATEDELEEHLRRHQGKSDYVEPDIPMNAIPEVRSEEEEDEAYWKQLDDDSKRKNSKYNVSKEEPASWGLDRIDNRLGLDGTYAMGSQGGKGVHVYIADTGIRTTHRDFHSRALPTLEIRSGIIRECKSSNDKCAQDYNGHGTHAAAIVGGSRYGVAKSSTLHSVKILSDNGRGKMSYLIQALDWVATRGLRPAVFTTSVGGPGNSPSIAAGIEAAAAAGVTVIVAAGNLGRDACGFTPAHVNAAITVGATENPQDLMATYSNFGECVGLFAPGSNIQSAGCLSDTAKCTMTGTSMASPHVAGAAALLLGEDKTRTTEEVSLLLMARATQGSIKGVESGSSPSLLLYTAPLEDGDQIWFQAIWQIVAFPSWSKFFRLTNWKDAFMPGPMKELLAEATACCLFLVALAFVMTR